MSSNLSREGASGGIDGSYDGGRLDGVLRRSLSHVNFEAQVLQTNAQKIAPFDMLAPPGNEVLTGTSCTLNSLFDRPPPKVHVVYGRLIVRLWGSILQTFELRLYRRRLCNGFLRLRPLERDLFSDAELWPGGGW